jgi:hypothetical protein
MATLYAKSGTITNFDTANGWNSAANGSGTDYTATDSGGGIYIVDSAANTLDLNGCAVTLNQSCQVALIQATTGTLTVSGTRTINGNVTYSGTSTSGMVIVPTGTGLTINGQATNTAAGYAIVQSGSGTTTITNAGGTAVANSGNGRGVSTANTGALSITGLVEQSAGAGSAVVNASTSAGHSLNGNLSCAAGSYAYQLSGGTLAWTVGNTGASAAIVAGYAALAVSNGTCNIIGNLTTSHTALQNGRSAPVVIIGGTINYPGDATAARSIAAGAEVYIAVYSGTLNLVQQSGAYTALAMANGGTFAIVAAGGTINTTGNGGVSVASVVNQTTTSYAVILGGTAGQKAIITGPTIPAAGDVDSMAADYGYAGALIDPTLVVPAEADVETGVQYGAGGTEFTGTLDAPTAAQIAAAMWDDTTSPSRTLT